MLAGNGKQSVGLSGVLPFGIEVWLQGQAKDHTIAGYLPYLKLIHKPRRNQAYD